MSRSALAAAFLTLAHVGALAQEAPVTPEDVATPVGSVADSDQIALVKVASGFVDPVNVTSAGDGSGRVFVVERAGKIRVVGRDGQVEDEPFLDLTRFVPNAIDPVGNDVQSQFIEQGLYAIAFHPRYAENGLFFVHYASVRFNGDGVVMRFQTDPESPDVVTAERAAATAELIMVIEQPSYNNNGGQIAFGPDGYLYIGLGDGGWRAPEDSSQDLSTILGSILRIDVDASNGDLNYAIPPTNPFADDPGARRPEIFAYGLHNPYEFAFDQRNGNLFITDVGDSHWEEINFILANTPGGDNFGWPSIEGTSCYPIFGAQDADCEISGTLPAAMYGHPEPAETAAAEGEFVCASAQGLGVSSLNMLEGAYLVGDWCTGTVYAVQWNGTAWQMSELFQTDLHFTAGGYDDDGQLLIITSQFYQELETSNGGSRGTVWLMPVDQAPADAEMIIGGDG